MESIARHTILVSVPPATTEGLVCKPVMASMAASVKWTTMEIFVNTMTPVIVIHVSWVNV